MLHYQSWKSFLQWRIVRAVRKQGREGHLFWRTRKTAMGQVLAPGQGVAEVGGEDVEEEVEGEDVEAEA